MIDSQILTSAPGFSNVTHFRKEGKGHERRSQMRHLGMLVVGIFLYSAFSVSFVAFASVDVGKDVKGSSAAASPSSKVAWNVHEECPICMRVIASAKETAKMQSILPSVALGKFCDLGSKGRSLEVADEKFCYDVMTMSTTLFRQLDLGGTADRCCKRVYQMNPDFCRRKDTNAGRRQNDMLAEEQAIFRIKEAEEEAAASAAAAVEAAKIAATSAEKEAELVAKADAMDAAAQGTAHGAAAATTTAASSASGDRIEGNVSATGDLASVESVPRAGSFPGTSSAASGAHERLASGLAGSKAEGEGEGAASGKAQGAELLPGTAKKKKKKVKVKKMGVIYE